MVSRYSKRKKLKFGHKSPRSVAEKIFQPRVTPLSGSELGWAWRVGEEVELVVKECAEEGQIEEV